MNKTSRLITIVCRVLPVDDLETVRQGGKYCPHCSCIAVGNYLGRMLSAEVKPGETIQIVGSHVKQEVEEIQ